MTGPRRLQLRTIRAAALLLAGCSACVIIVQPPEPQPVPVPVPTSLACSDPNGAPEAHVFFDVRVERTTVNLKDEYVTWMQSITLALTAAHIMPSQAVLVRLDERPVSPEVLAAWGCDLDSPEQLSPTSVLEYYATRSTPDASPVGCALDPLVRTGARLRDVVTSYPPELSGGTSGRRVFSREPALVLVVHIDERARRTAFDEAPCDGSRALVGADGAARWLGYDGDGVPMNRVVHWFVSTDELVDRETFVAQCKEYEGFPADTLDIIDPSPKALYGPLSEALADAGAARTASIPLCAMLVASERVKFLSEEIHAIADIAGTEVDEETLANVLSGGPPGGIAMPTPGG